MTTKKERSLPVLLVILVVLLTVVSCTGYFIDNFYEKESYNWQIQTKGQDIFNLIIVVPFLLLSGITSNRKNNTAALLTLGSLLYIIYSFTIYCFSVHFNPLFPVYCLILGIAFYSFLEGIYITANKQLAKTITNNKLAKITATYFVTTSSFFYLLWLSEIVPAVIRKATPLNLIETGLTTNPVHVLDLAIFLPGIFLTGYLIFKKHPLSYTLAVVILTFSILMDITVGWLSFTMRQHHLSSSLAVIALMICLATSGLYILLLNLKEHKRC